METDLPEAQIVTLFVQPTLLQSEEAKAEVPAPA